MNTKLMSRRCARPIANALFALWLPIAAHAAPAPAIASVVLADGRTLQVGVAADAAVAVPEASAPTTGTLPEHALPQRVRHGHTATLLPDGRVLVWGGVDDDGAPVGDGEWLDPATGQFTSAVDIPLLPRSGHSATVLSDGRLLILGGHGDSGEPLRQVEQWNWRTNTVERLPLEYDLPLDGHTATLLADGRVLIAPREDATPALYDPGTHQVSSVDAAAATLALTRENTPHVSATLPVAGARDVAVDALIGLRFSPAMAPESLNARSVTLIGPHGASAIAVVPAEAGRLVFVTPQQDLFPASHYTLFVQGAYDAQGRSLPPQSIAFETQRFAPAVLDARLAWKSDATGAPKKKAYSRASPRPSNTQNPVVNKVADAASAGDNAQANPRFPLGPVNDDDPDFWVPSAVNLEGRWRTGRPLPADIREASIVALSELNRNAAWRRGTLRSLRSTDAQVSGRVLRFSDEPLAGVHVTLGTHHTLTDAEGRFVLSGVAAGHHEVAVDGRTAANGTDSFGQFVIGIDVLAGKENPLKPVYLPKIRHQDWIDIPSPLEADLVVRSPLMPGFEAHLPKGTILRDREGKLVRRIAVIPMPLDRTPIDYPVNTPLHMTFQPAGLQVEGLTPGVTPGIRFIYPNYGNEAPGARAGFLNYDAAGKGWFTYGYGTVSADGLQVIPDPDTQIYRATGFGIFFGPPPPPIETNSCAVDGDPVSLRTGLFLHRTQGPVIDDVMPLAFGTHYRPRDTTVREFGKGTSHTYGSYVYFAGTTQQAHNEWEHMVLVLGDCSTVAFHRTSPSAVPDAQYEATSDDIANPYYGARIKSSLGGNLGVHVIRRDGMISRYSTAGGHLMEITDRYGRKTEFTRAGGQLVRVTTPSGRYVDATTTTDTRITALTDIAGRTWNYEYTADKYLKKVTYPDATVETFVYGEPDRMTEVFDRRGNRMVHNVYDAQGRIADQTLADGATYHFAYTADANGVISETQVTRPNGAVRRVRFDTLGFVSEDTQALGTPLQRTTTYTRDAKGFLTASVDPLNRRTEIAYDADKHVTGVTILAGTAQALHTTLTYTAQHDLQTITDPEQKVTSYTYDALRRLTGVNAPHDRAISLAYDTSSRLVSATDLRTLRTTHYAYDLYDLASVTDPDGRQSQQFTDILGRVRASVDPLGRRNEMRYLDSTRTLETTDPHGGVTTQVFDPMGNLVRLTDPQQRTTTWTYDARQRPLTHVDALGQSESWSYAPTGASATHTDRKLQTRSVQLDALHRPVTQNHPDGSVENVLYDAVDRVTRISDASGPIDFAYTALDQLARETTAAGLVDYGYDAVGRPSHVTPSNQAATVYGYDARDRLASLTRGSEVVGFGYNALDRHTSTTLPNGVKTTAAYAADNRLQSLTYARGSTTLGDLTYQYDTVGQLIGQGGSFASPDLPSASTTPSTADANHRLTTFGGVAITHDANGNLTHDGLHEYIYDVRDRLVEIRTGTTVIASFRYDALGRRIERMINGATTQYRYAGDDAIEETQSGTTRTVLTGPGIDERYARDDASGRSYFLTDHLGSTLGLTDASGNLTTRYQYTPYGETQVQTLAGATSNNPYQYTGRENDGNGLYFYRARYYSPGMGRFMAEDPLGFGDGINPYSYVGGNPLSFYDPYGLWAWGDPLPQGAVDFSAGMGDTLSFGLTDVARDMMGTNGAVNQCSGAYSAGEWSGIGLSLAFGGAHLGRGALNQMGKTGVWTRGLGRIISDNRIWSSVQRTWSRAVGGYKGRYELHHWFTPRSAGGSNAVWNYMPVSPWLNNFMSNGGATYNAFKYSVMSIYGAIPTAAARNAGSECGCG